MANVLAAACVVNSDGGDGDSDTCTPNSTKECTCSDGTESTRKCNASGTAYGSCACTGSGAGGSGTGSDGGAPATGQGGEVNTAGTPTTQGGETSTGGAGDGGMSSTPGEGGAGGSGEEPTEPLECQDPVDDCEACYVSCCDDWVACFNDPTCLEQFNEILVCIEGDTDNFTVDELKDCANAVGTAGGPWSDGLDPKTVTMINCLGGDPQSSGWADEPVWGDDSCNNLCFNLP